MNNFELTNRVSAFIFRCFLLLNLALTVYVALRYFGSTVLVFLIPASIARWYLVSYFKSPLTTPLRTLLVLHIELCYAPALIIREIAMPGSLGYAGVEFVFCFGQFCTILIACVFLFQRHSWTYSSVKSVASPLRWSSWTETNGVLLILLIFSVAIVFSLISFELGITRMGVQRASLPFNLAGALDWPRRILFPILFVMGLDFFNSKKSKGGFAITLILFCIWVALESYITFSKAKFIVGFILPVFLFLCYNGTVRLRFAIISTVFFLSVLLFASELNALRNVFNSSVREGEDFKYMFISKTSGVDIVDRADFAMRRVFRDADRLELFFQYSNGAFFNNRLIDLYRYGGTPNFITGNVLGQVRTGRHAEGTSAIPEGYLVGGFPLAGLTVIVLSFLFGIVDDRRYFWPLAFPGFQAACAIFCYGLLHGGIWTWFTSGILVAAVYPASVMFVLFFMRKQAGVQVLVSAK